MQWITDRESEPRTDNMKVNINNTITHCIRYEYNEGDKGMLVTQVT